VMRDKDTKNDDGKSEHPPGLEWVDDFILTDEEIEALEDDDKEQARLTVHVGPK
jgi:hypothetical protein